MSRTAIAVVLSIVATLLCAPMRSEAEAQDAAPADAMSMADIEEMMGPIALYPDTLLANVLAASVYPDEIAAAAQFMKNGGNADGVATQTWEAPVKSIAKAPEVLNFLNDNMEWTTAIGEVYVSQSKDVMQAVQNLRDKAKASGALQSSEQMTVVDSGSTIIIESADPEVIYVPQYQPQVVYAPAPVYVDNSAGDALVGGMIGFGVGLMVGEIFEDDWDCDWHGGCVGWGGNDIDIDRDVNIETGDINIGSGNTIQGGDRNRETNVQGGDRTNVQGGNRNNSVGREGQKWEPNSQKVSERQAKSGGKRASDDFRGASSKSSAAQSRVPSKTSAATSRTPSKPLAANNSKPQINKAGDGNRATSRSTPKPATKAPPSRSAPAKSAAPKKPPTPSAAPKVGSSSKGKSSGMSPNRGSSAASSRGASSRGGGGGSRGGGGGRGGGGRR